MVDSADLTKIDTARTELQALLEKPELAAIPLLVLGNKADVKGSLKVTELIDRLCVLPLCVAYQTQMGWVDAQ